MNKEAFVEKIMALEVFDTHSHLVGDALAAEDFWKIGEYFWLSQELKAAGYPQNAEELPFEERAAHYVKAFAATRNTAMNWITRRIFKDLYDIEITDVASVMAADEAIKKTKQDPDWADKVARKLNITHAVINHPIHANFQTKELQSVLLPRIDGYLHEWVRDVTQADSPDVALTALSETIDTLFTRYASRGCRGIMTTLPRFALRTSAYPTIDPSRPVNRDEATVLVLHEICRQAEAHGLGIQFFVGVEGGWSRVSTAANDTDRIVRLHGLFDAYSCPFELVIATEVNVLDVVQAARLFPNVRVGGMWWFTFRPSVFENAMDTRLEALPPCSASLIVSDARCIEWCYGKILLIKTLLADFLYDKIEGGWLTEDDALWVAQYWLKDSSAQLYL